MTTNKILFLRNLNDEEPENWQKFWKSFNAWFESDALNKNFINVVVSGVFFSLTMSLLRKIRRIHSLSVSES